MQPFPIYNTANLHVWDRNQILGDPVPRHDSNYCPESAISRLILFGKSHLHDSPEPSSLWRDCIHAGRCREDRSAQGVRIWDTRGGGDPVKPPHKRSASSPKRNRQRVPWKPTCFLPIMLVPEPFPLEVLSPRNPFFWGPQLTHKRPSLLHNPPALISTLVKTDA